MFSMNSARRAVAVGVAVLSGVTLAATAASAAIPSPDVPQDVAALLSGAAIDQVQDAAAETQQQAADATSNSRALNSIGASVPDLSGRLTSGPAHQVYGFTDAFTHGEATEAAVEPTEEWIAALLSDGRPAGTIRVWKPQGGPAELAGYTGDTVLATSLQVGSSVVIVEDGTIDAYYRLDGDTLTPLPASGQTEFAGPVNLAEAQSVIAARRTQGAQAAQELNEESLGKDHAVGGAGIAETPDRQGPPTAMVIGMGLLAAGAAGTAYILRRRRRRSLAG